MTYHDSDYPVYKEGFFHVYNLSSPGIPEFAIHCLRTDEWEYAISLYEAKGIIEVWRREFAEADDV